MFKEFNNNQSNQAPIVPLQSTETGEIPKEWSFANICPLFKKSDRSLACNYRPVSLTCVPCKLLEHIVCSNIMAHLDEYKLSDRQHAFRKGHSCETQLTTVISIYLPIRLNSRGGHQTGSGEPSAGGYSFFFFFLCNVSCVSSD